MDAKKTNIYPFDFRLCNTQRGRTFVLRQHIDGIRHQGHLFDLRINNKSFQIYSATGPGCCIGHSAYDPAFFINGESECDAHGMYGVNDDNRETVHNVLLALKYIFSNEKMKNSIIDNVQKKHTSSDSKCMYFSVQKQKNGTYKIIDSNIKL